jgi:hypothetical protein
MLSVLLNTVSEMKRILLHYCLPRDVLLSHAIFAANLEEKDPCFYSVLLLEAPWHTCLCRSWTQMLVKGQSSHPLKCHRCSASLDARKQLHIRRGMLNRIPKAHIVKHELKLVLPAFTYVWDWMSCCRGRITSKYLLMSVGYPCIRLSYSFSTIENLRRTSLKFGTLSWLAKWRKAYNGLTLFRTNCMASYHVRLERQEWANLSSSVFAKRLSKKLGEAIHVMNLSLWRCMLSKNM